MADQQVLALLGPPEDIRTLNDPGGISTIGTKEIWRYGTSGHLTIATLGQIYADQDSRMQYICGKGEPPPEGLFEEEELRRFLIALDEVPSYQGGRFFNPRALIVAVNLLQPLGKERALAAIAEYLRVACELQDDRKTGAFLVLRVLFEVPEDTGYMPPMRVGVPGPPAPNDPKLLPRFPITIEGDIPFLLIDGYCGAGFPQPPEEHVKYFREHGKLRVGPLVPTVSPLEAIERFARSPRWIYGGTNKGPGQAYTDVFVNHPRLSPEETYKNFIRGEPARKGSPRTRGRRPALLPRASGASFRLSGLGLDPSFDAEDNGGRT